jgi:hypothetical protein
MLKNVLITSDLHLSSKPRDEYRWTLFPKIEAMLTAHPSPIRNLFILGDLCEEKDYHASDLVNRVVDSLTRLFAYTGLKRIIILRGNHDGTRPDLPYFLFLRNIPGVEFFANPIMSRIGMARCVFLPHTLDHTTNWVFNKNHPCNFAQADYIFAHATFDGAYGENGVVLRGGPPPDLFTGTKAKIISGDVHVPQKLGKIEYCGTPYHIRFGDQFTPRLMLFDDMGTCEDVHLEFPRKLVLDLFTDDSSSELAGFEASAGDQVKVRWHMKRTEFSGWQSQREAAVEWAKARGVELCATELVREPDAVSKKPKVLKKGAGKLEVFSEFCKSRGLAKELQEVGSALLD